MIAIMTYNCTSLRAVTMNCNKLYVIKLIYIDIKVVFKP